MEKQIDATENPSRLENASARALSADRSEQASCPGTFSTMMSDRVIFSSASARIVAAEQVKGNKIAAMKPGRTLRWHRLPTGKRRTAATFRSEIFTVNRV